MQKLTFFLIVIRTNHVKLYQDTEYLIKQLSADVDDMRFLLRLLAFNPSQRITANEAFVDEYMSSKDEVRDVVDTAVGLEPLSIKMEMMLAEAMHAGEDGAYQFLEREVIALYD
jgi:hypothetical protein